MSHHGGKGYPHTAQIRSERRDRAIAVTAESGYSKLTTEEKLKRVLAFVSVPGNGKAEKQLAKLQLQLKKDKEPKPVKNKEVEAPLVVSKKTDDNHNYQVEQAYNKRSHKVRK